MSLVNTPRYLSTDEADDLCWYCGVTLTEPVANCRHRSDTRTQDHVFPLVLGGTSMAHNKVPCCNRCNSWKGAMELAEFRAIARPGSGDDALFFAEIRERELAVEAMEKKPFNNIFAEKLKSALVGHGKNEAT